MDAKFRQIGDRIDYTPGSAVSAGDVVVQSGVVGVATEDIAASAKGSLAVEGVFRLTKATSGVTFAAGAHVFWNTSSETAVTAPGANVTYFGKAVEAAAETTAYVDAKLIQAVDLAEADQAANVSPTQDALTDNLSGSADTTIADVTPAAAITDSSGGVDPGDDVIAAVTNTDSLTDSTGGSADDTLDAVTQQAGGSGVELTDGDAAKINNNFKEIADQLATQRTANTAILAAVAQLAAKQNTTTTAVTTLEANQKDVVAQLAKIKVDIAAILSSLETAEVMASS